MNILFTTNNNYLVHVFETIRSLETDNPGNHQIYIISNDVKDEDITKYKKFLKYEHHFEVINITDEDLKGAPISKRYPRVIYYRLFAAQLLPETIDKILYLDPDIIVKGNLDELYQMEMHDNLFVGSSNIKGFLLRFNQVKNGARKNYQYINTGVLLMNLKEMRKVIKSTDIYTFIKNKKYVLTLPDQDIINALYGNRIITVDALKYNLSDRAITLYNLKHRKKIDMHWVKENTIIIHYLGRNKPWKDNYRGILKPFYDQYRIH